MPRKFLFFSILIVALVTIGIYLYFSYRPNAIRFAAFRSWMNDPASRADLKLTAGSRCGSAPFIFPTNGMAGFLWGDRMGLGHIHQGIDVFGGTDVGITPVIAMYPGYLTRLSDWKSAVIVRVPDDPLQQGRQIWLYYTHMADQNGTSFISPEFPQGTSEKYIEAGTLLGHQGNYSGDPNNPVGVHLHFSIVLDGGSGQFKNELDIKNTLDPSPYLGLPLNGYENHGTVPPCK